METKLDRYRKSQEVIESRKQNIINLEEELKGANLLYVAIPNDGSIENRQKKEIVLREIKKLEEFIADEKEAITRLKDLGTVNKEDAEYIGRNLKI